MHNPQPCRVLEPATPLLGGGSLLMAAHASGGGGAYAPRLTAPAWWVLAALAGVVVRCTGGLLLAAARSTGARASSQPPCAPTRPWSPLRATWVGRRPPRHHRPRPPRRPPPRPAHPCALAGQFLCRVVGALAGGTSGRLLAARALPFRRGPSPCSQAACSSSRQPPCHPPARRAGVGRAAVPCVAPRAVCLALSAVCAHASVAAPRCGPPPSPCRCSPTPRCWVHP